MVCVENDRTRRGALFVGSGSRGIKTDIAIPDRFDQFHIEHSFAMTLVGANWNQLVRELYQWHQFGKAVNNKDLSELPGGR